MTKSALATFQASKRRSRLKKQLANKRDEEINKRQLKLEEDTAALEAEGAKADARRKVREAAEREMNGIRRRADAQIAALDEVFDRFRNLKVQDLGATKSSTARCATVTAATSKGGMGAAAIQDRLKSFDLEAESEAQGDHRHRKGSEEDPRREASARCQRVPFDDELAARNGP